MADATSWLPEHQLENAMSFGHANATLTAMADVYYNHIASDPINLYASFNDGNEEVRVKGVKPIPTAVSRGTGDFLNTLREIIEHTLFAEVEHALARPLTEKEAKTIEMPHLDSREKLVAWASDKRRRTLHPLHEDSPLFDRIEKLQPYHRLTSVESHPLRLLSTLTNNSKHRKPPAVRTLIGPVYTHDSTPHLNVMKNDGPLQPHDVLATVPQGTQIEIAVVPNISIEAPSGCFNLLALLRDLESWTRLIAVPTLITGTHEGLPPISPEIDVIAGYDDLRVALAAASPVSASDVARNRIVEETARQSLPDTITHLPSKPSRELAESFVATLDGSQIVTIIRSLADWDDSRELFAAVATLEELLRQHEQTLASETGRS